jgi:hypothetical protein
MIELPECQQEVDLRSEPGTVIVACSAQDEPPVHFQWAELIEVMSNLNEYTY